MIIRLPNGEWNIDYDHQLGQEGGFGTVYGGTRDGFPPLAIKKLKLTATAAANRELRMAEKLSSEPPAHVVLVYDYGQDADSDHYFIVMARAERNLREELDAHGQFSPREAAEILLDIVKGLDEIDGIVHRDLKPENVLCQQGIWKLGDFGIAKFVEEATSSNTWKDALTPQYAAPEQWKGEAVSSATDLYAVGCIAYELISGKPPFSGPDSAALQEQHLNGKVPALACDSPAMRGLVAMLLRKLPGSRPTRGRVRDVLEKIVADSDPKPHSVGLSRIADIGAREAERVAEQERQAELARANQEKRRSLGVQAITELTALKERLFAEILEKAPTARREADGIRLGRAVLEMKISAKNIYLENPFAEVEWDVICGAVIMVYQSAPRNYTRSASLWYTDQGSRDSFRWVEVSYWESGLGQPHYGNATPFAFEDPANAIRAHGRTMDIYAIATRPRPIDDEAADEFLDRWTQILATAFEGNLAYPSHLPMD